MNKFPDMIYIMYAVGADFTSKIDLTQKLLKVACPLSILSSIIHSNSDSQIIGCDGRYSFVQMNSRRKHSFLCYFRLSTELLTVYSIHYLYRYHNNLISANDSDTIR